MKTAMKWLVLIPLAAILLAFAVANRHATTVTFDPFNGNSSALSVTLPLFVIVGLAAMIGVFVGGIATWFGQAHHRRTARRARSELERCMAENGRLVAAARDKTTTPAVPPNDKQRHAA